MKVDWESLRPYIAFALGIALLALLSYRHRARAFARKKKEFRPVPLLKEAINT